MTGIPIALPFTVGGAIPVDDRLVAADLTTIPSYQRYEGLTAYQSGTSSIGGAGSYTLFGGITDGDWQRVGAGQSKGQVTFQFVGDLPTSVPFISIQRWTAKVDTIIDNVLATICGTEASGSDIIIDLLASDTEDSLWGTNPSNRPTIVEGTRNSNLAVPDTTLIVALDYFVPAIVNVGSVTPGSELIIEIDFHTA